MEEETFIAQHAPHLHRRGGEEFEREAVGCEYSADEEWLVCPCGARLLVPIRELSAPDSMDAVSSAFRRFIEKRFGGRQ
jgi:hypothetical protein